MKINEFLTGLQAYEQSRVNKSSRERAEKTGQGPGSTSDRVSLSQDAKLYKTGLEQAVNAEEVRAEKVADLNARVKNGTYQPDSRKIAEKMIQEDLESWFQGT